MGKYTSHFVGPFDGWVIEPERSLIFDADGNHYHIDEIRAIFFNRQLIKTLVGVPHDPGVVSLKQHLESKLRSVTTPVVTIDWGDGETHTIKHPRYNS